jgi:hypothetical protein
VSTDDPTRHYHRGHEQSEQAYESVAGDTPRQRQVIFAVIWGLMPRGATCDELEVLLGWAHQAVSARLTELKRDGWLAYEQLAVPGVQAEGRRRRLSSVVTRPTRSGRQAAVHFVAAHVYEPPPAAPFTADGKAPEPREPPWWLALPAAPDGDNVLF